jgi:competence protein ComEC
MVSPQSPMDTKCIYHRPVIPLVLSFTSGIVFGRFVFGYREEVLALVIISALVVLYRILSGKMTQIAPLILFAGLGWLYIQLWTFPSFNARHIARYTDSQAWRILGVVADDPLIKNRRTHFYLDVRELSEGGRRFPVSGKIRVVITGDAQILLKNDVLSFRARIKSFRNFSNPGGFDYERHMAYKGVWGSAYVPADRLTISRPKKAISFWGVVESERRRISDLITRTAGNGVEEILKALIIGDQSGISDKQREAFNRTGTGHLLAVSGLNFAVIATFCFFSLQRLLSRIPYLLQKAWVKKTAAVLTLPPVFIYALISGMSASVQRALIMVFVFLMTFWVKREQDLPNTLALAAAGILFFFPPALFSISFQLSFAAVAGILLGMSRFPIPYNRQDTLMKKAGKSFLASLSVSFFALLATLPLTLHYFNLVSVAALPANCIAVPIISFIVVPIGLASAFISVFSDAVAGFGFWISARIVFVVMVILERISDLPFSAIKTITPSIPEIVCGYLLMWGFMDFRRSRAMKVMCIVAASVLALDISYWVHRRFLDHTLRITGLDVGQGTANVLEFPGGFTMMIDGGGFSDNTFFDVGERIIAPFLLGQKIRTVDLLVLSHADSDHLNGMIYIADHFNVKEFWFNGENAQTAGYRKLMSVIAKQGIALPEFKAVFGSRSINGVRVEVLNPPKDFKPDHDFYKTKNQDDNGIVVRVQHGSHSFLFPGDMTSKAESELIRFVQEMAASVLFVPHHGSRSSSSLSFLNAVDPRYAVISAGHRNRFSFPHPEVLDRYRNQHIKTYRTDLNGAIRIETDGAILRLLPTILENSPEK